MCGHKAQRSTSTFYTGLKAIIINEEGSGDHDNPGNRAKDNPVLG